MPGYDYMKPASLKQQISSGGVMFRHVGSDIEVALVSVRGRNKWCLPKGLIDKGETPEMTAVREVKEETGLFGEIQCKIGDISYWYYIKGENTKCRKTVHFYLMKYISGNTAQHDMEVDDARWFPVETALETISFRGDRRILEKAWVKLREIQKKLHEENPGQKEPQENMR